MRSLPEARVSPLLAQKDTGPGGWPANLSRREFLILLPGLAAAGAASCSDDRSTPALRPDSLSAYLDVLIPADEFGPSASELGVAQILLKRAETDQDLRGLLLVGFRWLDSQTPSGFAALPQAAREQLMTETAGKPAGSLPRSFFDILRHQCFSAYYANPQAWRGLAIDRPPQPVGYPDYAS